ncbi:hypothetical protein BCR32DRAFT_241982 [Anaeromyces robustus]|jgi:hypothetical protein|uniref:Uncharacterized protein n=1 Tax=Anaeromyces robustus TaxID=1754192 RepID=A0A1Y1XHM3_9FUNG|nr:hypothetical protein BCR32DRAFT_241982 [Anaeromyces robustus]|eukprot:ORX85192.1 hypothetical protein BCR32DRAFT_241982 [Anaeromyces robustus]
MNLDPEDNNISSFNFGLNLEAELRLAQHKEQYQDFEVKASNEELLEEELDPMYLSENEDDSLVIKIPELADELQEMKLKEDSKRREMLENNHSINLKYNNFLVEKLEYLKSSIINIGSMMEYQTSTMDTIHGQLNEMKGVLDGINKEREQHKIERENKKKELLQKNKIELVATPASSNRIKSRRKRDSFTTLVNDELDNQYSDLKNKDIQPESLFKDDEYIGFLRICKVMDIMIQDAYTSVTTIPA